MPVVRPRLRMALAGFPLGAALLLVGAPAGFAAPGDISTVAGGGTNVADGIPATQTVLRKPRRVAFTPGGGFLVVEFGGAATYGDGRVRRVAPNGVVTTVAGTGVEGDSGDGGPAVAAQLNGPTDVAVTADGGYLIADEFNHRVRKVGVDGVIRSVAGTGVQQCRALSGAASAAVFTWPRSLAVYPNGDYLVLDEYCDMVHRVTSGVDGVTGTSDDRVATVAGSGAQGFAGDGGPAVAARLHDPRGVAIAADGGFYIADSLNHRIRRVWPDGVITTVAGTGRQGFGGNGGPATSARLNTPRDVEEAGDGGFVIADSASNRIRRVAPDGTITTLAGTGGTSPPGDGGPATAAAIIEPHGVNIAANGDLYISGSGLGGNPLTSPGNFRVRRVEAAVPTSGTPLPPPPRITSGPADGAVQGDRTPSFTVTGAAGATFPWRVRADGGSLLAGAEGESADGAITTPALPDGDWLLEVRQRASGGAMGTWTSVRVGVAGTGPPAPALTALPAPSTETRPAFAWTGAAIVPAAYSWRVLDAGGAVVAGPVTTAETAVTLPAPLAAGVHTFQVRQHDELGTEGAWASAAFLVTAPAAGGPTTTPIGPAVPVTPAAPATAPSTRNARRMSPRPGAVVPRRAVVLTWPAVRGAAGYRVRVVRLRGGAEVPVATFTTTRPRAVVPVARLASGERHVWRVWPLRREAGRVVGARVPSGVSWFRAPAG